MAARPYPCACNRLRRASRAMTQLYDNALAPSHLRLTQLVLLRTLAKGGPRTISALAQVLLLDRTALSRNLDPLVERALVAVVPGSDARTREVALTAAGRVVMTEAEPLWDAAQAHVTQRMGRKRLDTLYALLADLEKLHPASVAGLAGPPS